MLLVVTDDISGTFTFPRALPDHGNDPDLTPEQIGKTGFNYLTVTALTERTAARRPHQPGKRGRRRWLRRRPPLPKPLS
jgi:hypothetical protein